MKKWAQRATALGAQSRRRAPREPDGARALQEGGRQALRREFKGFEAIKDFALIAEDFTTDNGMLTPSLKVKRRKVIEKYGKAVEALYARKREKSANAASQAN